jgi:hypothetical protein
MLERAERLGNTTFRTDRPPLASRTGTSAFAKEVAMTVFLSYAHQDLALAAALRQDLEDMGQSVWIDESLHGGQIWWDEILHQLRDCHLFVLAVSAHALTSEACMAEWQYAVGLDRPFLPVRVDNTDWASAPAEMKQAQHIDYRPDDVQSTKALAKALNSVPDSVPMPDPLPDAPPAPQSYRERFARLFGPGALTIEEQVNYYVRLSLDVDGANSQEALELLGVLHARPDLSWKVRQDIDKLIAERPATTVPGADGSMAGAGSAATSPAGPHDDAAPKPKRTRLYWALGAVAGVIIAVVVAVIAASSGSDSDNVTQLPENATCDSETCSSTPIHFFVDPVEGVAQVDVSVTDPFSHDVPDVEPPTTLVGKDAGLEWTWRAGNEDQIGEYTVTFSTPDTDPVTRTFEVTPVSGPFGVVQRAAALISAQRWDEAAAIDSRIDTELNEQGPDALDAEYPATTEKHWRPYDTSGETNALSTTIIGAYIAYDETELTTTAYCEVWAVDNDGQTMRSSPLLVDDVQVKQSSTERQTPSYFSDFISNQCVAAAHPESS